MKAHRTSDAETNSAASEIETLKTRYAELSKRKTIAETNLENAQTQLSGLRKQSETEFGTSDPDKLQAKLDEMRAENERKTAEYRKHLDEIDAALAEVDQPRSDDRTGA